ncbi:MAG: hypothetical protein UZ22_OP11002001033 [Microgenomates bacterium OLB23]|nr:MAG: hypothetical protein UZ22_OP11002001033 [Microgenomates bacterium OLB23]
MINLIVYKEAFMKAHIQDQLFKRIYVPIELHFGGRLFYPEFLAQELSFVLALIVVAYIVIAWDMFKTARSKGFLAFLQSQELVQYFVLLSPLPFFALLTYAKSKLWWYMIMLIPFFCTHHSVSSHEN